MANQIIIDIGAVANDGTGDPLRTAFNYVNNNFSNVWATGVANSNISFSGNKILTTNTNGNLVLAPNGIGKVQANVDIVPNANNTLNLGSLTNKWNTIYTQYLEIGGTLTTGDLEVDGNLTVTGNIIEMGNIVTDAKTIQLANTAANASSANGSGITVGASDDIATLLYNSTSNVWTTNIGITATGNVTAPYFIGNGSQLTGITSYANSNAVAYGQSGWAGNIIPATSNVYSLGNSTNQWSDLYVSNATIYMNNVPISLTAGNVLTVDGEDVVVTTANGTVNLGNLTVNDYNIYNTAGQGVIISNFSFVAEDETAYVQIPAGNSVSDLNVVQEQGNVRIAANAAAWTFGTDGKLTAPGEVYAQYFSLRGGEAPGTLIGALGYGGNIVDLYGVNGVTISTVTEGGPQWQFGTDGSLRFPNNANITIFDNTVTQINSVATANGAINLRAFDAVGNVTASTFFDGAGGTLDFYSYNTTTDTNYNWRFDNGGSFTLPNAPGNVYFGELADQPVILPGFDAITLNANRADTTQDYITVSQNGIDIFSVNSINIENNTTGFTNSDINLRAGDDILLQGRDRPADEEREGGDLFIYGGNGSNASTNGFDPGGGGDLLIEAGLGGAGTGTGANGGSGGQIGINAGNGGTTVDAIAGSGGSINITAGAAATPVDPAFGGWGGDVTIRAGETTRVNENGGSITLWTGGGNGGGTGAAGYVEINIPSSNVGAGGSWTFTGTGKTLQVPADSEIYGASYGNFTVGCAGNTIVTSSDYGINPQNWVFGYTGNLVVPGPITQDSYDSANLLVATTADTNWAYGFTTNGSTDFYSQIKFFGDSSATRGAKILDSDSGNSWTFDGTGSLTLPGEGIVQSINDTVILRSVNSGTGNFYSARLGTTGGLYFETSEYPLGWLNLTNSSGDANISSPGGSINIDSANGTSGAAGKDINITAGDADQTDYYTTAGGDINIQGGMGAFNDGGGGGPGGNVNLVAGTSADPAGHTGNINITSGTNNWVFDYNGNLKLPTNSFTVNYANGTAVSLGGNYGNANVADFLDSLGSNAIVTTGNISGGNLITGGLISATGNINGSGATFSGNVTAANFSGNISITGNVTGTSSNVTLVAGSYSTTFDNTGNTTLANGTVTMTNLVANGTTSLGNTSTITTANYQIGYRDIPQVTFSANATAALTDASKHFYSTTAGNLQLTIPDNANVAFPTGATLTVVVNAAGNVIVAQGTGVTLYMAGSSTTGNRTVGAYGLASVMKVAANTWVISGTGVY